MTTQQQLDNLTAAVGHIEDLASKIKQALANDDPAEAEVLVAELVENTAALGEEVGTITPDHQAADAVQPIEKPEPPAD